MVMTNKELIGTTWIHKKNGGMYIVLEVAVLQTQHDTGLMDEAEMVIYKNLRGTFVREKSEFLDGRFEQVRDVQ